MTRPHEPRWDMTVTFVERRGRWWWNTYSRSRGVELSGWADAYSTAQQGMEQAIEETEGQTTDMPDSERRSGR